MYTCPDKGAPHLHRKIILIKATITLILTSLGIVYVEPQGMTILCILILAAACEHHVCTIVY